MGNKANKAQAPATPAPASAQALVLVVGKPPRIAGHTATKNGQGGTAGTWAAIAAHMAANGNTITLPALKAICTANGDPGFAQYAQGKQRQWLVPQAAQA
jgi:hypothetical protein